jgi:hypothetical protein
MNMAFQLIRREAAEQYFENVIVAFVITLLGTRLFLELTNYPQIAPGKLHIAHVLWGGLFMLVGSIIVLIYRNQSMLTLGSILTGVGWGLFIDELGKFVTADNDYFFKPVAPVIYLIFLCLLFLAAYVRRADGLGANTQIYHILDRFEEVIEASIDPDDLARIKQRLLDLSLDRQDGVTDELALALLHFIEREDIRTREAQPSRLARWTVQAHDLVNRFVLTPRAKGLVFPGVLVGYGCLLVVNVIAHLVSLRQPQWAAVFNVGLDVDPLSSGANTVLFLLMNALRFLVAMGFLRAARHLFAQRQQGWEMARRALLLAFVAADLLHFYFSQFSAAAVAVTDVALLGWVNLVQRYDRWQFANWQEGPPLQPTVGQGGL